MTTPQSGWGFDYGVLSASADMNSHQFKFVCYSASNGKFTLATGASNPTPLGVLQNDPRAGEAGTIRIFGTAKVAASGAIVAGQFISTGSNGFAIVKGASAQVTGLALTGLASGSGYIEALLLPGGYGAAAS